MQITLPPEIETLIQRQLSSGKYETAIEVLLASLHLLDQQKTLYQGRLPELQQAAQVGWQASQRGEVIDGPTAMTQILTDLRSRHLPDQP
jgi:antitoxin ParD1/3/4